METCALFFDVSVQARKIQPPLWKEIAQLAERCLIAEVVGSNPILFLFSMRNNRFVTLTDIENVLSNRFHCSASSADARLRRALYVTEFRCGEYPNPELERLRAEYRVDRWSVKRFIYAAARRVMNDFD